MPRTGRFTVEFDVDGKTWLAEFSHRHALSECPHVIAPGVRAHVHQVCSHYDSKGAPLHKPFDCPKPRYVNRCRLPKVTGVDYQAHPVDAVIKVQHVTSVKLRTKGSPIFLTGSAPCSLLDVYNWRKGLHFAMQRALAKAGYCTLVKTDCGHVGIVGKPIHVGGEEACDTRVPHRVALIGKKPIYDDIMRSFWREAGVKAKAEGGAAAAVPSIPASSSIDGVPETVHDVVGTGTYAKRPEHGLGAVELDGSDASRPQADIVGRPVDGYYWNQTPAPNRGGTYHCGAD